MPIDKKRIEQSEKVAKRLINYINNYEVPIEAYKIISKISKIVCAPNEVYAINNIRELHHSLEHGGSCAYKTIFKINKILDKLENNNN